jgi:hypothetical protein
MRRLALAGLLVGAALAFAACSLNPQPFPPADATGMEDASIDSTPFSSDGSSDGNATMPDAGFGDASLDATTDAGLDATSDATVDGASDATSDAESDATGD